MWLLLSLALSILSFCMHTCHTYQLVLYGEWYQLVSYGKVVLIGSRPFGDDNGKLGIYFATLDVDAAGIHMYSYLPTYIRAITTSKI